MPDKNNYESGEGSEEGGEDEGSEEGGEAEWGEEILPQVTRLLLLPAHHSHMAHITPAVPACLSIRGERRK